MYLLPFAADLQRNPIASHIKHINCDKNEKLNCGVQKKGFMLYCCTGNKKHAIFNEIFCDKCHSLVTNVL